MYYYRNELYHHGVLGMHWGIRRYQPYPKGHKGGKEVGEAAKKEKNKVAKKENSKVTKKQNVNKFKKAIKNMDLNKRLDSVSNALKQFSKTRIAKVLGDVGKMYIRAKAASLVWNGFATIYNSSHSSGTKLPLVNMGGLKGIKSPPQIRSMEEINRSIDEMLEEGPVIVKRNRMEVKT